MKPVALVDGEARAFKRFAQGGLERVRAGRLAAGRGGFGVEDQLELRLLGAQLVGERGEGRGVFENQPQQRGPRELDGQPLRGSAQFFGWMLGIGGDEQGVGRAAAFGTAGGALGGAAQRFTVGVEADGEPVGALAGEAPHVAALAAAQIEQQGAMAGAQGVPLRALTVAGFGAGHDFHVGSLRATQRRRAIRLGSAFAECAQCAMSAAPRDAWRKSRLMPTPARVVFLPQEDAPLAVEHVELPDPGPLQVVVRQFSSGICHSQLHQMHNPRPSDQVLGHEATGEVIKVGSEVTNVAVGDIVFVTWVPRDPSVAARPVEEIVVERPNGRQATTRNVFTWADHTIADEKYIVKVPQDTRRDVTSIIGCAVLTGSGAVYNTAAVREGDSVAIFGVGGVGLSAVVAAAVVKADPIIAVDLDDEKLEFAKRFGATHGVNAGGSDAIEQVKALTAGAEGLTTSFGEPVSGVDFAFDCIGREVTMGQILRAVRPGVLGEASGGTAVLVGVPQSGLQFSEEDMRGLLINEKRYIGSIGGSCRPDRDFPMFLAWSEDGDLDLDAMVTERFKISQINEATAALEQGEIFGRAILEFDD